MSAILLVAVFFFVAGVAVGCAYSYSRGYNEALRVSVSAEAACCKGVCQ